MSQGVRVRPEPMTTLWLALAAVVAGALAMFGDKDSVSMLTAVCVLLGLIPWALVVGGVELRSWQFFVLSVPLGVVIVVIDDNPGGTFPLILAIVWLARTARSWKWPAASILVALASLTECTIERGMTSPASSTSRAGSGSPRCRDCSSAVRKPSRPRWRRCAMPTSNASPPPSVHVSHATSTTSSPTR